MALRLRTSKFRHVFGSQTRREQTFENIRITRNTHDSNFCAVNPRFLAVVTESSGGGSFCILDVNRPGRVDINCPRVCGHSGAVLDIQWNPFNDCIIASGSDDSTVKIWTVPQTGLIGTLTDWSADLHGHTRKVAYIDWHPTAANVLMSVGSDYKIMVWNVDQAEPITQLNCHDDTIYSVSWGKDGSLIASTSKDKKIRIIDPRTSQVAMTAEGHPSAKASKIVFVADNQLFTTGFSRISDRQYALWDIRKADTPLVLTDLDCSSGILLPYFDPDINVVYLAGKGDGNIRYFEIVPEEESVHFLNTYQSPLPQRGLGMMPKRGIDPYRNEVARFYKVHASKNLVEPISMIVPRKAEGFQPDVFPPTRSHIPSLTADEWTSGMNRGPILIDLGSGTILDKPKTTMSPAVQPQTGALSKPPQITTYKAVPKHPQPPTTFNTNPAVSFNTNPAPFYQQSPHTALRSSPEGHAQVVMRSPSHTHKTSDLSTGLVNGRERTKQEPASIKNIKRLSMHKDEEAESDTSISSSQAASPASSVSPGQGRASKSSGSLQASVSPPLPSPSPVYQVNGYAGETPMGEHHISFVTTIITNTTASSVHTVAATVTASSSSQSPGLTRTSRFGRSAAQPRFNTISGSSNAEHVSAITLVIGQPTVSSHANAIHVRKVWSPPVASVVSPSPVFLSPESGGTPPSSDPELKKAYFRQLEEIRSLQEQLVLKDKRIKQLEKELAHIKERESSLGPGESNC